MKKILKKVVAFVSAAALAVGMLPAMSTMTTKAADGDIKLYFKLPATTSVSDWGVNIWGGASLVDPNGAAAKPLSWQGGVEKGETLPGLNTDDADWAFITVNGNVDGIQFVNANPSPGGTVFNCWNSAIASLNLTEAYFDTTTEKWYKEKACINEIKMLDVAFEVFLIGQGEKFGNWNLDNAIMLSQNGNIFSTTIKQVPAGTYQYKFVQDKTQYAWTYSWGGAVDALTAGGGDLSITVTELSDITFEFTETAIVDNIGGNYDMMQITAATLTISVEASGITAQEIIDAISAIGNVTLDSKDAIEAAEALYASANAEEQGKVTNI